MEVKESNGARIVVLFLVMGFLVLSCSSQPPKVASEAANARLGVATQLRYAHKFKESIEAFQSVIRDYPGTIEADTARDQVAVVQGEEARWPGIKDKVLRDEAVEAKRKAAEDAKFFRTKAGRICKKHPQWSRQDCTNIAEHRVWIGMTLDMLIADRGKPNSVNPTDYGHGVRYQYCWYDWRPMCVYDENNDGIIDKYN
jgi:hypothetical protein